MFLTSKYGQNLGTESLGPQRQEKPRLPGFGGEEAMPEDDSEEGG